MAESSSSFGAIGKQAALRQLLTGFEGQSPVAHRLLVEGTDFDLTYFPLRHLGHKAVVEVSADLFAQMRHPEELSVRLGVSAKLDFPQVAELFEGAKAAAAQYGYKNVSLDLTPSRNGLIVSVSATGKRKSLTEHSLPRAQSKDILAVSGRLGAAYLGLQVLERERLRFEQGAQKGEEMEKYRMQVGAYLHPELSAGIVSALEDADIYPSAAVVVSHGLADAVKQIAARTGLGAKVYANMIPFEGNSFELGKLLDIDPVTAAMNGGEDHQLLVAVPILQAEKFRREFQTFQVLGHLAQSNVGTVLVAPNGVELPLRAQGWKEQQED